jgi:hypothetical protein
MRVRGTAAVSTHRRPERTPAGERHGRAVRPQAHHLVDRLRRAWIDPRAEAPGVASAASDDLVIQPLPTLLLSPARAGGKLQGDDGRHNRVQTTTTHPGPPRTCPTLYLSAARGAAISFVLLAASNGAWAQINQGDYFPSGVPGLAIEPGVTVRSRAHPEYDHRGVRVGSVLIRPELTESIGYDSNVLGTSEDSGSALVLTQADLRASNNLSRYGLNAALGLTDYRYLDLPKQSYLDWTVSLGGTYNIGRDTAMLSYEHAVRHETPRDLDAPLLDAPIAFRLDTLRAAYRMQFARTSMQPELTVARFNYDDGTVASVPYRQSDQNRVVVAPGLIGRYELAERRDLLLIVRDLIGSYTNLPAQSVSRDFNDVSVLGGIDYDGGGRLRYQLLAGYEVRTFSSAALQTLQAPVVDATVIFTPTGLTTITGGVARRIESSTTASNVGYTSTTVNLVLDHELRRNVILTAYARFAANEYNQEQGEQYLYRAGAGATWLINRNLRLSATYDYADRHSSPNRSRQAVSFGPDYSSSRYLVQLSFGL